MVERRVCSFCGNEIEPGTGKIYIKVDGTIYNFCKNKCHKNLIKLKRIPRRTTWTQQYMREKSAKMSAKGKKGSKRKKAKPTKEKAKKVLKKVSKAESESGKTRQIRKLVKKS
ncbi:MAG: 50S ribosomal protein L24e [Thermoplasmata archaeon]